MSRKSTNGPTKTTRSCKIQEAPDFLADAKPPPYCPGKTVILEEEIHLPDAVHALRERFDGATDNSSTFTDDDSDAMPRLDAREEDSTKKKAGGILADEMGMGRTIQAVACVLDRPLTKKDREDGWKATTLFVTFSSNSNEIEKCTVGLKFVQFHGPKREKSAQDSQYSNLISTVVYKLQSEPNLSQQNEGDKGIPIEIIRRPKFGRGVRLATRVQDPELKVIAGMRREENLKEPQRNLNILIRKSHDHIYMASQKIVSGIFGHRFVALNKTDRFNPG
ncbi:hypothetical protein B0H19DRAFT_1065119 [Mycena capillaripes]|nr:hypothetical protein B0H19DRAFT_1065119 [Mycena capillaripes]